MADKQNKPNWAVEAMDPPPGVSSFPTFNTQRDGFIQRRNPQFENEPPPIVPPIAPIGNRSESSSRRTQIPEKLEKAKNLNANPRPGKRFSAQRDGI